MTEARLPNDLALERDVLAMCLARPERILELGLSADEYALDAHRIVWSVMLELAESGAAVNLATIRSKLIDADDLAKVGGEKYLETLRLALPVQSLPVDRLLRLSRLRKLRSQAEAVAAAAAGNDADMAAAALDGALAYASQDVVRGPKSVRQLAAEYLDALGRDPNEGTVSWGLPALKRILHRLDQGSMTLIGADVNCGKSTVALEMLFHCILDGENVGYLSVEDPDRIVTQRIISMVGGVSPSRVRLFRGEDTGDDAEKIDKAMRAMHALDERFLVSSCVGMNEREILDEMTIMARKGVRVVVVDYIGVIDCSQKQQNRVNEIRWIATRLKARAARLGMALVVVSQFSRPEKNNPAKKPTKHSFRESGDLEAMAEYAIVMWREVEDDFAPVFCEIAKSKTGRVGWSWTMQREKYRNGKLGSGRLLEVRYADEDIVDDRGNLIPEVMPDDQRPPRWTNQRS